MARDGDTAQRFVFEDHAIRGELVSLDASWRAMLEGQTYPTVVRRQLGELLAATALLASTLKYEGRLTAQVEANGPLRLMVVQCTNTLAMRGVARFDELKGANSFAELTGIGRLIITIHTKDRAQPYQGVVPLVGDSLVDSLEHYFESSAQLSARLWLHSDATSAKGMLLQKLPQSQDIDVDYDAWHRVQLLADTVKPDELTQLSNTELLRRLFHEESVRLFESKPVSFRCSCSRGAMAKVLQLLGREEIDSLLEEHGYVEVCCEFCNRKHQFDPIDIRSLSDLVPPPPSQRH